MRHEKPDLTSNQRRNLRKLAAYLLNGLKARFDMGRITDDDDFASTGSCIHEDNRTECGAVGCAMGHGPYAGIPKRKSESWWAYADRQFTNYTRASDWCFHGCWADVDKTAKGAARRILYMLDKGIPENWYEQMDGTEPLTYKRYRMKAKV